MRYFKGIEIKVVYGKNIKDKTEQAYHGKKDETIGHISENTIIRYIEDQKKV